MYTDLWDHDRTMDLIGFNVCIYIRMDHTLFTLLLLSKVVVDMQSDCLE